jgi:hypothetical protein
MRGPGIDLADRVPRTLIRELAEHAHVVVAMGCGDECALHPRQALHRPDLRRPKGRAVDKVRATRDDIARPVDASSPSSTSRKAA